MQGTYTNNAYSWAPITDLDATNCTRVRQALPLEEVEWLTIFIASDLRCKQRMGRKESRACISTG